MGLIKAYVIIPYLRAGTLAERLAHQTHNPMMDGSNPGRSNKNFYLSDGVFSENDYPPSSMKKTFRVNKRSPLKMVRGRRPRAIE